MNRINKVEQIVERILEESENAQSDDFLLVYKVYSIIDETLRYKGFNEIVARHKELKLPPFETITRCRRKIQARRPELQNEKQRTIRINETSTYIDYALQSNYKKKLKTMIDKEN